MKKIEAASPVEADGQVGSILASTMLNVCDG
jgi:hypothetical protein